MRTELVKRKTVTVVFPLDIDALCGANSWEKQVVAEQRLDVNAWAAGYKVIPAAAPGDKPTLLDDYTELVCLGKIKRHKFTPVVTLFD